MGTGHSGAGQGRRWLEGTGSTTPPPSADPVPKDGRAPALHRTRGNTPLLFLQQHHKWNSPPTPTANLSSLPAQGPGLSTCKGPSPFLECRVQGNGGWERGCGPGHRPCPLQTSALPGRPACCLFRGAFPDPTPPGTPLCILDVLPWQSQVTPDCVYGTRTCQL